MKKLIFSLLCFLSINAAEQYNSVFEPGQEITIRNETRSHCLFYLAKSRAFSEEHWEVVIIDLKPKKEAVIDLSQIKFEGSPKLDDLYIGVYINGDREMTSFDHLKKAIGKKCILRGGMQPGGYSVYGFHLFDKDYREPLCNILW